MKPVMNNRSHTASRAKTPAYIPPLRYRFFTRFYDPLVRLTTREATFKGLLVEQAQLKPGDRVLDLGCGTATLSIALASRYPGTTIVGLDADGEVLRIARNKSARTGAPVRFDSGHSDRLPYDEGAFDVVASSLFFHQLTREQKQKALAEIFRVLRPGGRLHIADWGKPVSAASRALFLFVQLLDGFETTQDSVTGILPELMRAHGFAGVEETHAVSTPLGTIRLHRGSKP
jgi:ubiquinone/menaquinone biosynthesis C-methylase UbiE